MALFEQWVSVGNAHGLTVGLIVMVAMLGLANWRHGRKILKLESQLDYSHQALRQEIKMMGQGAIGVGQRVKHLEKQIRKQPSPFEQVLMQQPLPSVASPDATLARPKSEPRPERVEPKRAQSRAERALSQWMSDTRHSA